MTTLPVDIDATYEDIGVGVKIHQQHHDVLHALNNSVGQPDGLAQLDSDGKLLPAQAATNVLPFESLLPVGFVSGTDVTALVIEAVGLVEAAGSRYSGISFTRPNDYKLSATITISARMSLKASPGVRFLAHTPITTGSTNLFNVVADNVTFDGFVFDGAGAPAGLLAERKVCIFFGSSATGAITARHSNAKVKSCRFLNLTRKGAVGLGNASLDSEYGVYFNGIDGARCVDSVFNEVSGVGAFFNWCNEFWFERNEVRMLTTGDCLYPVHCSRGNQNGWITDSLIEGGFRRYGGAVDVMSTEAPSANIHIERIIVDGCNGADSGTAVLRMLSVQDAFSLKNCTVKNITTEQSIFVVVNYRDLPTAQPGPENGTVSGNTLICGAPNQRAMDVKNANPDTVPATRGGRDVVVDDNKCLSDGTNRFAAGIRGQDIVRFRARRNVVEYAYSAALSGGSWGMDISSIVTTMERPVIEDNEVDGGSSASSRCFYVNGAVSRPTLRRNHAKDWGTYGIRLDSSVFDPIIEDNTFDGPATTTALSVASSGQAKRSGNRLSPTAATHGTFTIPVASTSVTVTTAEVQTGDRITLNITSASGSDKPVKAIGISAGVSFIVRTVDQSAVATAAITGTWQIEH